MDFSTLREISFIYNGRTRSSSFGVFFFCDVLELSCFTYALTVTLLGKYTNVSRNMNGFFPFFSTPAERGTWVFCKCNIQIFLIILGFISLVSKITLLPIFKSDVRNVFGNHFAITKFRVIFLYDLAYTCKVRLLPFTAIYTRRLWIEQCKYLTDNTRCRGLGKNAKYFFQFNATTKNNLKFL